MNEKKLDVLKFDAIKIPVPTESQEKSNEKYVSWGVNNLYPNYLLQLYAESSIHSSIINSKANYILGGGVKYDKGDNIRLKVNAADTFDEFISKCVKDYLIFNCFAVEVIYNKFNEPIEYHFVPVHKVRTNKNKTKFWVSQNWMYNEKPIIFERWKNKPADSTSKIFFYDGYIPTLNNVYQIPDYYGSILSIVLESEIKKFNLNNIQNQFSVSTLITFFNGVSDADIRKKVLNDLKQSYTGSEGKKMIVDFQTSEGKGANVQNLSPGDWDKAYDLISKSVKEDIMQGHSITTPMLFGVMVEGKLGGSTEMETGYEIFQNTYVRNKRNELLSAFNVLFTNSTLINGRLEFADKRLFDAKISDDLKSKVYTYNEVRADLGLTPLPDGDRLIDDTQKQGTIPPTAPNAFTNDESFSLTEEDFIKIKDMGVMIEEFDFIEEGEFIKCREDFSKVEMLFETSTEIGDYILKNDVSGLSIKDLKAAIRKDLNINITISDLKDTLNQLNKAGVVKISIADNNISVTKPTVNEPSRKIEVMYSYDVRPGYGQPIIDRTRPFCRRLVENNRYYTREEIQTMSEIFGYNIFELGGGYYRNPKTHELTTHCRHWFKSQTVSRKIK